MEIVNQLLNVPSIDPDDARRRKLLNILLIGMAALVLVGLLASIVVGIAGGGEPGVIALFWVTLVTLVGITIIFAINRFSGRFASSLFLLLLIGALALSDTPQEVARGRTLFIFVIPILMASVLLNPWASFIIAGLVGLVLAGLELFILQAMPNVPAILGFFVVALVAWLAARSLEQALEDLRAINRELDQRVADRTRDLAEALSRNQAILEGIADGVIVFDNDGRAAVANPAIADLLDRPADQIVGSDIQTLMGEDVSIPSQELISDLLEDKEKRYPSIRLPWGEKTLSVSAAPVRDDANQVTGTVAVFRDFTREAEVERMKSAFVSMVSHELRTPLGGILGYTEMLQENFYGPLSDKQMGAINRIIANARELLDLVNDLLDRARLEAGRLTLHIAPFSPADLIDGVMGTMIVLARDRGLELTSHIADDVPETLLGDRQRLQQILVNFVGNAIKFTEQGHVHIRVYRPDTERWALAVADTGPGIPKEAQSYVFDPFRQVDDSATRTHGGAGLGLSIVRQLAELMGGEIELVSKVGHGSVFTVLLPLVLAQTTGEESK